MSQLEATGAVNFLALDDLPAGLEGEPISPASILSLAFDGDRPQFPPFEPSQADPFLQRLQASGKKWVVITDGPASRGSCSDTFRSRRRPPPHARRSEAGPR